ncbi:MAG TPA: DUF962 domain-containing protein [Cytophagales bacterium]|jgi:hypothetical protein|nr:DUF962 domain-containing protein [Cytophagales bacterium]
MKEKKYSTLMEFYPYYLSEHQNGTCRVLHFIGTALVFMVLAKALLTQKWLLLAMIPVVGYGFAWIGHAFYEKNKPATFKYPFYSLASDFILFFDILKGKETIRPVRQY